MTLKQIFARYEAACISFSPSEKEKLIKYLSEYGFAVPKNAESPILAHRNKSMSFVRGFAANTLYSLSEKDFKKFWPEVLRIEFRMLSDEKTSEWYRQRG